MATTSATASTGSNIDVASIVSQLMTVEQRPLTALATKEASVQAKLSAYGTIQGALGGFQSAMSTLSNLSLFQGRTAGSSDSTVLTASAGTTAAAGTYTVDVSSLAQSQKLVALGQNSQTTSIGASVSSTLTFDFGTIAGTPAGGVYPPGSTFTSNGGGTHTVTIDSTNNSLQGIRDAINAANMGVTATIINDGSASPYRLSLSSSANGASNSIKISVAGDAAISSLLAHDPAGVQNLTESVTAQNANFTVNGVAVSKASNNVTDVIEGVSLNLLETTTTPLTLSIAKDTSAVTSAVSDFVKAYNSLHKALKDVSSYDAATKTGAILQGDFAVRTIDSQVRRMLDTPVTGAGALSNLSQIGVDFQKDGSLALNSGKLNTAMSNSFGDVAAMFSTLGNASDSLISYSSATATVKPGNYGVNITQLATQGSVTGLGVVGTTTIATGSNDTLNISIDGVASTVTLTAGVYTATSLAAEVQAKINGAGTPVSVTEAGGLFTITSNTYGSTSSVAIAGNAATNLLGGAPVPTAGLDVAGTIAGQAATGSGQFLTSGGGDSLGLKLLVSSGALGARGTVSYSHGYATTLSQLASSLLAKNGLLDGKTSGLNSSITDIGKQRDALNARLVGIRANYTKQFSALDVMLSSMNTTSNYLAQQLANLPKSN